MAAGLWTFYNDGKKHLGDGGIDLDTHAFRMQLHTGSSNAATLTLSDIGQVTNQVANQFGYLSSGKLLTGVTWLPGSLASKMRFTCDPVVWTASGGSISDILYAVISDVTGGLLVCYSKLSDSQFSVTSGNALTVSPASNGIFELS